MKYEELFLDWLNKNTEYGERTKQNIVCRVRRADTLLPITYNKYYIYELIESPSFKAISSYAVKSQIKKAVKLYIDFLLANNLLQ